MVVDSICRAKQTAECVTVLAPIPSPEDPMRLQPSVGTTGGRTVVLGLHGAHRLGAAGSTRPPGVLAGDLGPMFVKTRVLKYFYFSKSTLAMVWEMGWR